MDDRDRTRDSIKDFCVASVDVSTGTCIGTDTPTGAGEIMLSLETASS